MKNLKTIVITLIGVLVMIACKNEKEKVNQEQIENPEVSVEETPTQEEQQIGFQKTLTLQDITFEITTIGEGSVSDLIIQPNGLEIDNQKIVLEIDGQVVNAEIEDLNSDWFPEILVYTVSAGSGSYGNVIGYSVNNGKSISQIYFPDISENKEAGVGYMGHDEFAVVETSLVQRFPIYKSGDSNSNPTGGTRQIQYKLQDGEASRLFVIDKISEY
ncbi:PliI family lysozyme inhibitor of I-type lysozyme [Robiginitalea sp.]|uniref:PliI family lysozyme inhibitor of I-type lysozyme n=1 Tax=Robiginitalea sp. TaxID=1902411 RepID=UPI003C770C30